MSFVFANPAGLWTLLGIPAILLIHFIQQRYRRTSVSTFFLLEPPSVADTKVTRFSHIKSSAILWVQLLFVLVLTVILSQLQLRTPLERQRVAIVLDSSYSMAAFPDAITKRVSAILQEYDAKARFTEWSLLESAPYTGYLYRGTSKSELLKQLSTWKPSIGQHSFDVELLKRRRLVGVDSTVIFLSDKLRDLSADVEQVAIGQTLENWGITGYSVVEEQEKRLLHVAVRNFGLTESTRRWWIATGTSKAMGTPLTLAPGEMRIVRIPLVEKQNRFEVGIEADEFALDDTLPFVIPKASTLKVYLERGRLTSGLRTLVYSADNVSRVNKPDTAQLSLRSFRKGQKLKHRNTIEFLDARGEQTRRYEVLAESHPFTAHLRWDGLRIGDTVPVSSPNKNEDESSTEPLLWANGKPAVVFDSRKNSLRVLFDIRNSNAMAHPAFVLLLNRFINEVRRASPGESRINVASGQRLSSLIAQARLKDAQLRVHTLDGSIEYIADTAFRAPNSPGFFELVEDGTSSVLGATSLSDISESDFSKAESGERSSTAVSGHRQEISSVRVAQDSTGILLLIVLLVVSWSLAQGRPYMRALGVGGR